MTVPSNHWSSFEGGETIGKHGSENGVILEDEEYASGARITLEGSTEVAPFAITCGCYGLFLHTRFFSTEEEARAEFSDMKVELKRMVDIGSETASSDEQTSSILMAAAGRFVDRFPT
jgi:hypothetical protein